LQQIQQSLDHTEAMLKKKHEDSKAELEAAKTSHKATLIASNSELESLHGTLNERQAKIYSLERDIEKVKDEKLDTQRVLDAQLVNIKAELKSLYNHLEGSQDTIDRLERDNEKERRQNLDTKRVLDAQLVDVKAQFEREQSEVSRYFKREQFTPEAEKRNRATITGQISRVQNLH
jgi:chromosome segregation ATPase